MLDSLGIGTLVSQYRQILGIVFLFSTTLLIVEILIVVYRWIQETLVNRLIVKSGHKRLHALTEPEKKVLRSFIFEKTRSRRLDMTDGVVNELESESIIFRSSNLGHGIGLHVVFAFNIQPWAWDYLNAHPELLSSNTWESTPS